MHIIISDRNISCQDTYINETSRSALALSRVNAISVLQNIAEIEMRLENGQDQLRAPERVLSLCGNADTEPTPYVRTPAEDNTNGRKLRTMATVTLHINDEGSP